MRTAPVARADKLHALKILQQAVQQLTASEGFPAGPQPGATPSALGGAAAQQDDMPAGSGASSDGTGFPGVQHAHIEPSIACGVGQRSQRFLGVYRCRGMAQWGAEVMAGTHFFTSHCGYRKPDEDGCSTPLGHASAFASH
jgi:hypothetical protein